MMTIRKAVASDADDIYRMHISSIRELCSTHYTPEQIKAWTETLQPDRYVQEMKLFDFYVAECDDGRMAGILIADKNAVEINALYVAPFAAGRGLGKRLLLFAESMLRSSGCTEIRLKATLNAEPFYLHHGFERVGCSAHCLGDERALPCMMMRKRLAADDYM